MPITPHSFIAKLISFMAEWSGYPSWEWGGIPFTPAEFLAGHILTESSGEPSARHADILASEDIHGDWESRASYGLLQVEGTTFQARLGIQRGIPNPVSFSLLYDPVIGLRMGMLEFLWWLNWAYQNAPKNPPYIPSYILTARALAGFNGGFAGAISHPPDYIPANVRYVERVFESCKLAQKQCLFGATSGKTP